MLGHLGAISLKNLTKRKEVRKGADQANYHFVSSFTFGLCNSYNSISMPESDIYKYNGGG